MIGYGLTGQESLVSTHSRPKAAAILFSYTLTGQGVSTHSRPKAAATFKVLKEMVDAQFIYL